MRVLSIAILLAPMLVGFVSAARADFFDDVRRTFQKDIPRTFEHDIPRAFGATPKKTSSDPKGLEPKPPPSDPRPRR